MISSKTCNNLGVQIHFKGTNTIKPIHQWIRTTKSKKVGVIYWFQYPHSNFQGEYIGESRRSFGERLKEHLTAHSPLPSTSPQLYHRTPY